MMRPLALASLFGLLCWIALLCAVIRFYAWVAA